MTSPTTPATVNEALLQQMAAEIREEIPEAEVRLFGSHARGDARPDSDIDLLITVTDGWLAQHNRFEGRWICCCFPARRRSNDCSCTAVWCTRPTSMGGGSMADADALALVSIARRDLVAARGMTDATVFHEAVWGFQVQQTIEKALKAWLYLSGVEPPFTHDLVALLKLLEQAGCDITPYRDLDRSNWNGRAEALVSVIEAMLPPPALP